MSDTPGELWECENCGQRAINGNAKGWTARGEERWHACERLLLGEPPKRAFRVTVADADGRALMACVRAMRRWGGDEDGIHHEAQEAYVMACKALGLPAPWGDDAPPETSPSADT